MKPFARRGVEQFLRVLLLIATFPAFAQQSAPLPTAPILNPEKEGAELAARLRDSMPAESAEFTGTLSIITRDDHVSSVPISSRVRVGNPGFTVSYTAAISNGPPESLLITHTPGASNVYALNRTPIGHPSLTRPFAGSDFWLCDLGLEFFHWPQQRLLRNEMRRSRSCWVLESATPAPAPGGYARVVSWIDVEHSGILRAEACGVDGKLLKEFLLGSMRKVEGRWQLESMKMRNVRTGSETELKFDLGKP